MNVISLGQIDSVEFIPVNVSFDDWHLRTIIQTIGSAFFVKEMLKSEQLHVAPVDALEYLTNHSLTLIQSACISYKDVSKKLLLFSNKDICSLENSVIAYPKDFGYEAELLKIILFQNNVDLNSCDFMQYESKDNIETLLSRYDAVLSCEKVQLKEYEFKAQYVYDLAQEWKKLTGLPFVHYVWVAWSDWEKFCKDDSKWLNELIRKAVDMGSTIYFNKVVDYLINKYNIEQEDIENYYKIIIDYDFGKEQRESIELFRNMCDAIK